MTWEAVIALATVAQVLLVAAASTVALIQVRHLRHQNDLAAFLQLANVFNSPKFRRARTFVTDELAERLRDPAYRREIIEGRMSSERHPEGLVLNHFGMIGRLLGEGVVRERLVLVFFANSILQMWEYLLPVIALRRTTFPLFMVAFEALVIRCRSIDTSRELLHVQRTTPRSLMPMWETSRREIDKAYADLLATTESKDQAAG